MTLNVLSSVTISICLLYLLVFENCNCAKLSDSEALLKDLFGNYSKDLRPVANQSERVIVTVGLHLFSINDFDEVTGIISMVTAPIVYWKDYRLMWTPAAYGGLQALTLPKTKLWIPDLFLLDPVNKMEALGDDDFLGRISYSGMTIWLPGGLIQTTCDVDMSKFPLDTQTCSFTLITWGYLPEEVYLVPLGNTVDFTYFSQNALWDVVGSKASEHSIANVNGLVKFEVILKRKPLYFFVNMLAPIFLLCFLNPLVFILPVESGERVSYSITIFLSLAVFMTILSDNLPKASEPMAFISYFLVSTTLASTASCILTIFTMTLHFEDVKKPVSRKAIFVLNMMKFHFIFERCRNRPNKLSKSTRKISNFVANFEKDGKDWENHIERDLNSNERNYAMDQEITWTSVAKSYDKVLFVYSTVFTVIQWVVFIVILTT